MYLHCTSIYKHANVSFRSLSRQFFLKRSLFWANKLLKHKPNRFLEMLWAKWKNSRRAPDCQTRRGIYFSRVRGRIDPVFQLVSPVTEKLDPNVVLIMLECVYRPNLQSYSSPCSSLVSLFVFSICWRVFRWNDKGPISRRPGL